VFKQWLADRPADWSQEIEVVAMDDGFSNFKTIAEEPPTLSPSWIHSMPSASPMRRSISAAAGFRRPPQTTANSRVTRSTKARPPHRGHLLTDCQRAQLGAVFESYGHVEVEAT